MMKSSFFGFCQFMCNLKPAPSFPVSLRSMQQPGRAVTGRTLVFVIAMLSGILFLSSTAPASDGKELVLYYNFDNDTLPAITDRSTFGNNGEAYEKVVLTEGISGKGAYFDGTLASRIIVPASESLNITKDLTISFCIKPSEVIIKQPGEKQNTQDLFFRAWDWRCLINRRGQIEITMPGATGKSGEKQNGRTGATAVLVDNKWTQIAYVFKGEAESLSLYIDGEFVAGQRCGMNASRRSEASKILLGGADGGWSFKGAMDEIRVYNYAMDEKEVKAIGLPVDLKKANDMRDELKKLPGSLKESVAAGKCSLRLANSLGVLVDALKARIAQSEKSGSTDIIDQNKITEELFFLNSTVLGLKNNTMGLDNILCCQVKPISDVIRLPGAFPADGRISTDIEMTAAQGEFEPASFVLRSFDNIENMTFKVMPLESPAGTISPSAVDLRVVKCWYQADCAWKNVCRLNLDQRVMVPELLLHDENIITIDEKNKDNYIRLDFPGGAKYECISKEGKQADVGKRLYIPVGEFPVRDSDKLLPVKLIPGQHRQFWVTVKIPAAAKAGNYSGRIVLENDGRSLGSMSLRVRVLPFALPQPQTSYDLSKEFSTSIYNTSVLNPGKTGIDCTYRNAAQLKAEFINLRDHGITSPMCYQLQWNYDLELLDQVLSLRDEAGLSKSALYMLGPESCMGYIWPDAARKRDTSSPVVQNEFVTKVVALKKLSEKWKYRDLYIYGLDESRDLKIFDMMRIYFGLAQKSGVKGFVSTAGLNKPSRYVDAFLFIGDLLDLAVNGGDSSREEAARWHSTGKRVWMYNAPTAGLENPLIYRQNFGLKLWRNNYDGFATYLYYGNFGNPWNDFDNEIYRDHNFVYPTVDGVVDTIAWEGSREAVDDIRYATLLKTLCSKAAGDESKEKISSEAEAWFQSIDFDSADLDAVRLKMIDYILKLQD